MKIGIIGAGNVGGTLGLGWAKNGHEVRFGVRDPGAEKVARLVADGGKATSAATVSEAVAGAEVVVLTTPWAGAEEAIRSAGDLGGKVLIDCTNPLTADLSGLTVGGSTSAAEQVAAWSPAARVVKAFNTIGTPVMADPSFGGHASTLFIAGDDAAAKGVATGLAEELGFEVVDAGPLTSSRALESLALLWLTLAFRQGLGTEIAFKLLRR